MHYAPIGLILYLMVNSAIISRIKRCAKQTSLKVVFLILLFLHPLASQAIVLDWSTISSLSWSTSGGTYTTSINFDSSNPGNDVTITISGNTSGFLTSSPYNSPGVSSTLTGGQGSSEDSLLLAFNWGSRNNDVTVTFHFNYADGIKNVEFALFDIDRLDNNTSDSGFRDYVSDITGSYKGGSNVIPTITVEDSSYTSVVNAGKSTQGIRGEDGAADNSDNANAYISFGTNVIDEISFTYGNWTGSGSKAPSNPGQQGIGVYDFNFDKNTKVPEVGSVLGAISLCLTTVLITYYRRKTASALPGKA